MPRLVDTTIRLLGQEPLAGLMPTSQILRLAELLDVAGFEYLEVSGGGVFDTAVRRGVDDGDIRPTVARRCRRIGDGRALADDLEPRGPERAYRADARGAVPGGNEDSDRAAGAGRIGHGGTVRQSPNSRLTRR